MAASPLSLLVFHLAFLSGAGAAAEAVKSAVGAPLIGKVPAAWAPGLTALFSQPGFYARLEQALPSPERSIGLNSQSQAWACAVPELSLRYSAQAFAKAPDQAAFFAALQSGIVGVQARVEEDIATAMSPDSSQGDRLFAASRLKEALDHRALLPDEQLARANRGLRYVAQRYWSRKGAALLGNAGAAARALGESGDSGGVDATERRAGAGKIVLPLAPSARRAFAAGEVFDESRLAPGTISARGVASQTEEFLNVGDKTYLVWFQGPKKGRVYRALARPSAKQLAAAPKTTTILAEIDGALRAMDDLTAFNQAQGRARAADRRLAAQGRAARNYAEINALPHWKKVDALSNERKLGELLVRLHRLYDGEAGRPGLKLLRFYDPQLNRLVWELQQKGFKSWLSKRARELGLKNVDIVPFMETSNEQPPLNRYYYGKDELENNVQPQEGVVLLHGTYDNILSDVVQEAGLKAGGYRHGEIEKKTGEGINPQGHRGDAPGDVSFWYDADGRDRIIGGYGVQRGFESPILFGITAEKARALAVRQGGMPDERVVAKEVLLKDITHLFVPAFAVAETREILSQHGAGHVKILPLGAP